MHLGALSVVLIHDSVYAVLIVSWSTTCINVLPLYVLYMYNNEAQIGSKVGQRLFSTPTHKY